MKSLSHLVTAFCTVSVICLFVQPEPSAGYGPAQVMNSDAISDTIPDAITDVALEPNAMQHVTIQWEGRTPLPAARNTGAAAAAHGRIYFAGGIAPDNSRSGATFEYNIEADAWITRANMLTLHTDHSLVADTSGKLYALAGSQGIEETYDPAADTWTAIASIPTFRYAAGAAETNGLIYVIGGASYSGAVATFEAYNPVSNTWTTRVSLPSPRAALGVARASNGRLYAAGGIIGVTMLNTLEEYDPATNTWTARAPMPTGRQRLSLTAAPDGKVYAIGGEIFADETHSSLIQLATVEVYDPATDTWDTATSMPTPRSGLATVMGNNGRLYALGGYLGSSALATVEDAAISGTASGLTPTVIAVTLAPPNPTTTGTLQVELTFDQPMNTGTAPRIEAQSAHGGDWTRYNTSNSGLCGDTISSVAMDAQQNIWFWTHSGACHVSPAGVWTSDPYGGEMLADPVEGVWLATDTSVAHMRASGLHDVFDASNSGLPASQLRAAFPAPNGEVWVSTAAGVYVRNAGGAWRSYTQANSGLSSDDVRSVYVDRQGRAWFMLLVDGLDMLSPGGTWTHYTTANTPFNTDHLEFGVEDQTGNMWFTLWDGSVGGVARLSPGGAWTMYQSGNSPLDSGANHLALDPRGSVWVGDWGGAVEIRPDGEWLVHKTNVGVQNANGFGFRSNGDVWIGSFWGGAVSVLHRGPSFMLDKQGGWEDGTHYHAMAGTGTVTPPGQYVLRIAGARSASGVTMLPHRGYTFTVSGPGAWAVMGRVSGPGNQPIAGVTVSTGAGASTATDAAGSYTLTLLAGGAYTVTPSRAGYAFTPASRMVSGPPDVIGADFTASALTYSITGRVVDALGNPVTNVLVVWESGAVFNDVSGYYTLTGVTAGNHGVTAMRAGYRFTPASRDVSVPPNRTGMDFSAEVEPQTIPWTFMLYLDGDNNLSSALEAAIHRLEAQASNPNVTVVVLYDAAGQNNTHRLVIQPGGHYTAGVNQWYMGELNMGDPQTLAGFIQWARENYPSDHTYLSIADHGRGTEGVAWDDTNGDFLSVRELQTALSLATNSGANKIDVVHYDACLMALLENAYQVRAYANYLVASQNIGWGVFAYDQYAANSRALSRTAYGYAPALARVTAATTPAEFAAALVSDYYHHPGLAGYPRTISAMDLGQVVGLKDQVNLLATVLHDNLSEYRITLQNTHSATQKFDSRDYFRLTNEDEYLDLYDFARRIRQNITNTSVRAAADGVMTAIASVVISESHQSGTYRVDGADVYWDLDGSHGVSIYYPPVSGSNDYNNYVNHTLYSFTADSAWDNLLVDYFGVMGLPPEPPGGPGLPPMLRGRTFVYLPLAQR